MALPQNQRLKNKRLIEMIKKKGKKVHSPFFLAFVLPSKEEKTLASVAVTLKREPKAVHRNQIKRRISEAVRILLKEDTNLPKVLIMIFGKKEALDADFEKLKEEVQKIFKT